MTETDSTSLPLASCCFRKTALKEILSIKRRIPSFSRCSQFLAMCILDKYVEFFWKRNDSSCPPNQNTRNYAIACLFLACKFNGTNEEVFQKFIQQLPSSQKQEEEKNKIFEAEAQILLVIDYQIPIETSFTYLQYATLDDKLESEEKKVIQAKCLKIMLLAVEASFLLTQNPSLGTEIYNFVKNKSGTRRAIKVYQEAQKILSLGKSK